MGGKGAMAELEIEVSMEETEMIKMGSYGGKVKLLSDGEDSAAEEIMLLWGMQQPTLSKPNSWSLNPHFNLPSTPVATLCPFFSHLLPWATPGVTGSVMWDSGVILGKFLEHAVDSQMLILQGKKVVELGAGCGLVGSIAALVGAQVALTDLPDRLRLLKKNIEANLRHTNVRGSAVVNELT